MVSKFEFHCHSQYSNDSNVSIDTLIKKCQDSGITGIALTDHNEIKGSLEFKNKAPQWLTVIIGEEINTASGEVIGLFLNKKIEPGLSLFETITEIKNQNGLVILPHPFDRLRSKIISKETIEKYIDYFDILEIFNARTVFSSDNEKARQYALQKKKPIICGSDAHFLSEYGKTTIRDINCDNPQVFLESLKKASFKMNKASLFFHIWTKYEKLTHKFK